MCIRDSLYSREIFLAEFHRIFHDSLEVWVSRRFTVSGEGDVIQRLVIIVALFQNLLQSFSYLLAGRALLLRTEVGVESAFAINAVE